MEHPGLDTDRFYWSRGSGQCWHSVPAETFDLLNDYCDYNRDGIPCKYYFTAEDAINDLKKCVETRKKIRESHKISWDDFYLGLAFTVSRKSPDEQTKHGCMIVRQDHRPISFGFNGFPRNANDEGLPTTRPDKYDWMYHGEKNALANAEVRPEGATAYITGQSCKDCIYSLWQHGVKKVVMADREQSFMAEESQREWFEEFVERTGMKTIKVKPNLNWLKSMVFELQTLGFVDR